jgi:hypothetical protein
MVDLGEAEAIDQMVPTFRAGITGHAQNRGTKDWARPPSVPRMSCGSRLRAALFDPLLKALAYRKMQKVETLRSNVDANCRRASLLLRGTVLRFPLWS